MTAPRRRRAAPVGVVAAAVLGGGCGSDADPSTSSSESLSESSSAERRDLGELDAQVRDAADRVLPAVLRRLGGRPVVAWSGLGRCNLEPGTAASVVTLRVRRGVQPDRDALQSRLTAAVSPLGFAPRKDPYEAILGNGREELYLQHGGPPRHGEAHDPGYTVVLRSDCVELSEEEVRRLAVDPGPEAIGVSTWTG